MDNSTANLLLILRELTNRKSYLLALPIGLRYDGGMKIAYKGAPGKKLQTIHDAMLEQTYLQADELAKGVKQTVGDKNNYYITLEQL